LVRSKLQQLTGTVVTAVMVDLCPLLSKGTEMYTNSRTPTQREIEECNHIVLTSNTTWEPSTVQSASVDSHEVLVMVPPVDMYFYQSNISMLSSISAVYDVDSFKKNMRATIRMCIKQASNSLQTTTQRYVQSALLPLSCRYCSNQHFYHCHLNQDFAADLYIIHGAN
jgi:hypothetical protein